MLTHQKTCASTSQFCALKPECRGMDLSSFLLKPIQRICKYPLLLRELIKHTHEKHSDYDALSSALKEISDVVEYVNEKRREFEQSQQVAATLAKLEFSESLVLPRNPTRTLVCEGVLQKMAGKAGSTMRMAPQRLCVLFCDVLIVAKPSLFSGGKAQVNAIYSIWSIKITNVADSDRELIPDWCRSRE
nr:guanine nucleotide exchange factor 9 [Polyrhizophydium stewartii]